MIEPYADNIAEFQEFADQLEETYKRALQAANDAKIYSEKLSSQVCLFEQNAKNFDSTFYSKIFEESVIDLKRLLQLADQVYLRLKESAEERKTLFLNAKQFVQNLKV